MLLTVRGFEDVNIEKRSSEKKTKAEREDSPQMCIIQWLPVIIQCLQMCINGYKLIEKFASSPCICSIINGTDHGTSQWILKKKTK